MPPMALENGLWVGNVPKELLDLTFVERLFVRGRLDTGQTSEDILKIGLPVIKLNSKVLI